MIRTEQNATFQALIKTAISLWTALCFLLMVFCFKTEAREYKRSVSLEFEAIEDATKYEVRIQRILEDDKKKAPVVFTLKDPLWEATINYGKYELTLRAFDDRGVPGEWSEAMEFLVKPAVPDVISPKPGQNIKTGQADEFRVPLAWQPVPGATSYELQLQSTDGKFKESITVENTTKHDWELDVGRAYSWKITAIMADGLRGETQETPNSFALIGRPLEKPEIDEPASKFVQEITWDPPKHADTYNYALYFKEKNGKWKRVDSKRNHKEPNAKFNLANPTGEYQIKVMALGTHREPSPLASKTFMVQGDLRSPAAIEAAVLKDSLSKPTHFYAIASYFITQMSYQSDRYESGQRSSFQGLGGTGRLGVGYQNPFRNWGTFAIVDLGGINIDGENYTFASAEAHGTWKFNLPGSSILMGGAGLFMKELPELRGNKLEGVEGVEISQTIGPHAGFKYWMPISHKLGFQINARAYYSMMGTAPNGKDIQPALSYQAGVLGSLRLSKELMGYAGYAYRLDQASYSADPNAFGSSATSSDVNLIRLEGHYLNLILEYSF